MRPRIEQYGLAVLAPLCQNILLHWIRMVLGDKPASNPTSVLSSITWWTCTCTHCIRAKTFLTSGTSRNLILERIGAPSCKHVEQQIGKFARLAATYDTVRTSPQGLNVRTPTFILSGWRLYLRSIPSRLWKQTWFGSPAVGTPHALKVVRCCGISVPMRTNCKFCLENIIMESPASFEEQYLTTSLLVKYKLSPVLLPRPPDHPLKRGRLM